MTCLGLICFKASSQPEISCSVVFVTLSPSTSPFRNMVCIIRLPLKRQSCSNNLSKVKVEELGTFNCPIRLSDMESSFNILSSILFNAKKTSSLWSMVEFESTAILAFGKKRLRVSIVSSIISANSGCMVGSPFPAKVITSGATPSACMEDNLFIKASFTSARVGSLLRVR